MDFFDNLLEFSFIDVIDVILFAILLYYVYKLVKGTVAINIFLGIVIIYIFWKITQALEMELLSTILGGFISAGMFALIVVFQQEIRKFLLLIGSTNFGSIKQIRFLNSDTMSETDVNVIITACERMGETKTGALIVLERNNNLDFVTSTGDDMSIRVNQPIIESIFYKNSPLHDGAIVIKNNKVIATRVILPVNNDRNIPKRFGLRHRAALGISEKTDALAIAVSEETGHISYFKDGEQVVFKSTDDLKLKIDKDLT